MLTVLIDYDSGNLHSAAKAFERMARETDAGEVLVSGSTLGKLKSTVRTGRKEQVQVKGISDPVAIYEVTEMEDSES